MKAKTPQLAASLRERVGTRYTRRVRDKGLLPAVVYGHGVTPVAVAVDAKAAITSIEAGEKIFTLAIQGEKDAQMVLLKELQFDHLGTDIIHADFARVDLNEKVRTRVHVELAGDAKGLKLAGAILLHPATELEIECKVKDIPEKIVVDISELDMDQQITAADVKLPVADMRMLTDPHAVVAQIVEQKEEVVAAEAATVATDAPAQPEVIGEKEREAKKAETATPAPGAKAAAPAKK